MAVHDPKGRAPGHGLLRAALVVLVAFAALAAGAGAASASVTITSPLNGSVSNNPTPSFSGVADAAKGEVTVRIYAGPSASGTVLQEESIAALSPGGSWTLGPFEKLKDGIYAAKASQAGAADSSVTFTINTAPPVVSLGGPTSSADDPTPSFTGTATDTTPVVVQIHAGSSAHGTTIVSLATGTGTGSGWTSGAANPPLPVGQYTAVATQLSSLGNPAGRSGEVAFNIVPAPVLIQSSLAPQGPSIAAKPAGPHRPSLMQPFPVVRIAGVQTAGGVRLKLLKVQQTPVGARVTVRCRGRGCPLRFASRLTVVGRLGVVPVAFGAFERYLRAGVVLEVLVTKPGQIGKFTRFSVRRGRFPVRTDMCLGASDSKPIACPGS